MRVELIGGRGVDQRDAGSLLRKVHRVDEGVGAADGVTGKDVRAPWRSAASWCPSCRSGALPLQP